MPVSSPPDWFPPATSASTGRHLPLLAPSILAGDHAALAESTALAASNGCRWIHIDIMDGHFVPNLTFGPQTVADLRRCFPQLFFDVHLMISQPPAYCEAFARAGADCLTIHIEPAYDHRAQLAAIRQLGLKAGISLNPGTPAQRIEHLLGDVDLVLVMTVQPGFGGQSFRQDTLPKLAQLDQLRQERQLSYRLEVDGGIGLETAPLVKQAGADTLVCGSAFFKAADKVAFRNEIESPLIP